MMLALLVAACGSAAEPAALPAATPTILAASAPTMQPTASPTTQPTATPTALSTATPAPPATAAPEVAPDPSDTPVAETTSSSVTVGDQALVGGEVTIEEVASDGPGWVVIHAQADGKPGTVVGYAPVVDGVNSSVMVEIDLAKATTGLYAMLHTDAGDLGTWEFPDGPDTPIQTGDGVVMAPFSLEVAAGDVEVAMVNVQFDPALVVVKAGTTVTWVNNDGAIEHNVESDANVWHSELFAGGGSFSYTFEEPGLFTYHCHPHGDVGGVGMAGTVVVLQ